MKVHHIAITVSLLEVSTRFYELFGFKVVWNFERPDLNGKACLVQFKDFSLELWEFTDSTLLPGLDNLKIIGIRHLAFAVESIEEKVDEFFNKGIVFGKIKQGASGGKYAFTSDPNGVQIEFYELPK